VNKGKLSDCFGSFFVALSLWMLEKEYFLTHPQPFFSPLENFFEEKACKKLTANERQTDLIHIFSFTAFTLNTLLSWRRVFFQERLIRKYSLHT